MLQRLSAFTATLARHLSQTFIMTAASNRWRPGRRRADAETATAPYQFDSVEWAAFGVILLGAVLRISALKGPGYSLDEEITFFAVQGIRRHGLPLFPSG